MIQSEIQSLPIAVRVYPEPPSQEGRERSKRVWRLPEAMLVFDTETRVDATQRLTFGCYRFIVRGRCLEEGLFYADDLPRKEKKILTDYVATHHADTVREGIRQLHLLTLREFTERLYRTAYKGRCLLVAFNSPFDISRIAHDCTTARGRFAGGFSFGLWSYTDKKGKERRNQHRPRIGIKQIDSKRALKGFTARNNPDRIDLIPEGSTSGRPEQDYIFRGHFLDLRTLAFALTDRGYSLEAACEAFGVEHGKQKVNCHGIITEKYIDYNRQDVLATSELAFKLLDEYGKHPISLQVTKAYSPASIGKAYLRAMGIRPILERQPDFPKEYLGYAQSAFFGGRTSAHIRKVPVPVVYTDFLSMYPTVNSLMGLWRFVTAQEITVEHCRDLIQELLTRLKADDLFKPETWKYLTAFVQIIPDGDILPSRAKYSVETKDWQVAVNHLYTDQNAPRQALWFSLPDVVASVIQTGRVPKIIDAFRLEPKGEENGLLGADSSRHTVTSAEVTNDLKSTRLRGVVEVDPKNQDFFKVVIEERKRLSSRTDLSDVERKRLDKALKVLANAASYGIYAEMNRREADDKVKVTCHGIDREAFTCRVAHPDVPGEYCFPPLASLITGAARLMLALLEYCVTELGGTYAMEDTDSMAIVATEHGSMIPCGKESVKALSWGQVAQIVDRFAALNPYDRSAIPGSILKIERDNFDPRSGDQRRIYCAAISAKRYDLYLLEDGIPILLREGVNNGENRWSEHGLGHLLNPTNPESDDRVWIAAAWLNLIRKALGLTANELGFENLPAVSRTTVSSRAVMRPFSKLNEGKRYADQIKPFNFLLTCHVRAFGHPIGVNSEHFHLIAPYEKDPTRWLSMDWVDQYTANRYRITTTGHHGTRRAARVKTYGDVLSDYEFHPEAKCADTDGRPCGKQTLGLLQRRHVRVEQIKYIGKESNSLEEVELGLIHSENSVYTEYPDTRRGIWQTITLPALKAIPLNTLVKECKGRLSRRALIDLRAGRSKPHQKNQETLATVVNKVTKRNARPGKEKVNTHALQEPRRQTEVGTPTSRAPKRSKEKTTTT